MGFGMIDKSYIPSQIEPKWEKRWLAEDYFWGNEKSSKPPFSIVIPPPNVTGSLHLGHALNNALQDILCRYKRMTGHEVCWIPGTDHAGIATQNVVERQLQAEGKSRHDLGREAFVARVWKWKEQSGGQIITQLKRLGCSCDWQRERFTMDPGLSHAVREVFIRLYHEGLIYRGDYMINWCPRCESALADLEVEYPEEPEEGALYRLRYPLVNPQPGLPDAIIIDTTRPETMLGDTAVAVHPEDPRFQQLVGQKVTLPLVGRVIPIIADSFVDPEFGSGAVKITPGHDPNDFEAGRRHQLEVVSVIGPSGKMTAQAGNYAGLDRFVCRERIVEDLKQQGVLLAVQKHQLKTGRCYRCRTVTEPLVSTQWFLKTKELAAEAKAAIVNKKTRLVPVSWQATYFQWLDNIRDWCISRQLWWGHQIPVWYCSCGHMMCQLEAPSRCVRCESTELKQDPDVLDTWFSSALWPFSTMGWPEQTATLKKFYPTTTLVTGFDILFFWVARMMMMGLKLTGKVPFYDIYLHAMVRDEHGQKMSKTKGNVIDPLQVIEQFGADALRFTLAILTVQGRDLNLATARIEGYRNFINKIWNALRYVLMVADGTLLVTEGNTNGTHASLQTAPGRLLTSRENFPTDLAARWIRSRLARLIESTHLALEQYEFSEMCTASYRFFWDEFCSWYLEISKLQLKTSPGQGEKIVNNLLAISDVSLRILHPVIPFVTEELWQALPSLDRKPRVGLAEASYPTRHEFFDAFQLDEQAESQMTLLQELIGAIRTVRSEKDIDPGKPLTVYLQGNEEEIAVVNDNQWMVKGLARVGDLHLGRSDDEGVSCVVSKLQVFVSLKGAVDAEEERKKLKAEIARIEAELARVRGKLANESFLEKAAKTVVEKEQAKLREFEEKLSLLRAEEKRLSGN